MWPPRRWRLTSRRCITAPSGRASRRPGPSGPRLPPYFTDESFRRNVRLRGKTVSGISEFLGIPYAAPPTGKLRWHAPEPSAHWRGVRDATAFGPHCPQPGSASGTSENCLFLNVFTKPGVNPAGRPVMVWVHGGAQAQASLASAEMAGAAFAAKVGCAAGASAAATAACLRAVPVSTLVADENGGGYTPDLDGLVLRQSIVTALRNGQFHRVPVIMGTNRDEWRLFVALAQLSGAPAVTAASYQAQIQATLGVSAAAAAQIVAQYPVASLASPPIALGAVGTDAIFACNSLNEVSLMSRVTPTFAYEFNDENAPQVGFPNVGFPLGADHASELQYLLDPFPPAASALSAAQRVLSAQMKAYWSSQAKHGPA